MSDNHVVLPYGVESFTTLVEGMFIEGLCAGNKQNPIMVFLHGQFCGAQSWLGQLGCLALQQQFHLVAWNAPGYGRSESWPHTNPSALNFVIMLKTWLNQITDRSVVIVGHGLGALIACAYAARFPAQVKGLILAAPAIGYIKAGIFRKKQGAQDGYLLSTFGHEAYALERLQDLIPPNPETLNPESELQLRIALNLPMEYPLIFKLSAEQWKNCADDILKELMKLDPEAFEAMTWTLMNEDIETYRHYFHGPTAVWASEFDTIVKQHEAQRLAIRYHSQYILFSGSGHLFYLEQPSQFNQHLLDYMHNQANPEHSG